jgi:hypothetical protein
MTMSRPPNFRLASSRASFQVSILVTSPLRKTAPVAFSTSRPAFSSMSMMRTLAPSFV